jgi:pimeloyl-ACP methyl ester carboxylesterase
MSKPDTRYIIARDGTRIAYTLSGQGPRTIVLSNGIGCNEVFLRGLSSELEKHFRVLSWHYRGHGDSDVPADYRHTDYPYLVEDLKQVLADAKVRQAVFIGFSMGVEINFEFYRNWPEMVTSLIQICGAYEFCLKNFFNISLLHYIYPGALFAVRRRPNWAEKFWRFTLNGPWTYAIGGALIFDSKRFAKSDWLDYQPHIANIDLRCFIEMAGYLANHSAADLLSNIDVPTLIIAGTKDNFTPVDVSRKMARLIPQAELIEIEGGTHGTTVEYPERVNPAVVRFIKRLM